MSERNVDVGSTRSSEVTTGGLCLASLSLDQAATSGDDEPVQKRKTRRVRSLIKSSIERFKHSKPLEQQQQQHRPATLKGTFPPGSLDKRPFPFGHW